MYIGGVFLVVFLIIGLFALAVLYEQTTCFDGLQNGDEIGIDCGGVCGELCDFQVTDPVVLWNRLFEIAPGVYSAIAFVENPNVVAHAHNVPYVFSLRDERGMLVATASGDIYLPPASSVAIFERSFNVASEIRKEYFLNLLMLPIGNQPHISLQP